MHDTKAAKKLLIKDIAVILLMIISFFLMVFNVNYFLWFFHQNSEKFGVCVYIFALFYLPQILFIVIFLGRWIYLKGKERKPIEGANAANAKNASQLAVSALSAVDFENTVSAADSGNVSPSALTPIARKINLVKEILFMIFVHIFADVHFMVIMVPIILILSFLNDLGMIISGFVILMLFFIVLTRLMILPVLYDFWGEQTQSEIIRKFIYSLKNSVKTRILVLFLCFVFYLIGNMIFSIQLRPDEWRTELLNIDVTIIQIIQAAIGSLICSIIFGLVGDYLVLFSYWWLKRRFKGSI